MKTLALAPAGGARGTVRLPGSKSITNRVLLLAACSPEGTPPRPRSEYDFASAALNAVAALNSAHRFGVRVAGAGVELRSTRASAGERHVRMRLTRVSRGERRVDVPAGAVSADGARAEIARPELGLTEWYENRSNGLEQFVVVKGDRHALCQVLGKLCIALGITTRRSGSAEAQTTDGSATNGERDTDQGSRAERAQQLQVPCIPGKTLDRCVRYFGETVTCTRA